MTLTVGQPAPSFTLPSSDGGTLALDDLRGSIVVLYFYPRDNTPGCTAEAHEFAEATDDFRAAGATVIGMSADPIDKLARFSTEECRDKFAVASAGGVATGGSDAAASAVRLNVAYALRVWVKMDLANWQTLRSMPKDEIKTLADESGAITADCQFCGRLYRFPVDKI